MEAWVDLGDQFSVNRQNKLAIEHILNISFSYYHIHIPYIIIILLLLLLYIIHCAIVVQGLSMWCTYVPELQYRWARADGSEVFSATNPRTLNPRESSQLGCCQQDVLRSRSGLRQLSNIGSAGEFSPCSPRIHTRHLVSDVLWENWRNRYSALNTYSSDLQPGFRGTYG